MSSFQRTQVWEGSGRVLARPVLVYRLLPRRLAGTGFDRIPGAVIRQSVSEDDGEA